MTINIRDPGTIAASIPLAADGEACALVTVPQTTGTSPPLAQAARCRLPNRRMSLNIDFEHAMEPGAICRRYQLTIGFYRGGRVGEIFLDGVLVGCELEMHLDDAAALCSRLLQHGEPPSELCRSLASAGVLREALRIAAAIEQDGPEAEFTSIPRTPGSPI
jgi:hypothetical protein